MAIPSVMLDIAFGMIDLHRIEQASASELAAILAYEIPSEALVLFVPCLLLITAMVWLSAGGPFSVRSDGRDPDASFAKPVSDAPVFAPPFWSKLQRKRHGRLLALEAQQHYLVVHTTVGSELIYYRFRDAVDELRDWEGAQVHRSFWIARSAIADIVMDGRKSVAVLRTGLEVPISRGRREGALARFAP